MAFTIAAALFTVGVISFLDSLSEGPCDAEAISICITMGFVAVFLGAWAGSLQAVALFIWFAGFIADGAIRGVVSDYAGCRAVK